MEWVPAMEHGVMGPFACELTETGTARKSCTRRSGQAKPQLSEGRGHKISPLARCTDSCWLLGEKIMFPGAGGYPSSRSLCAHPGSTKWTQ